MSLLLSFWGGTNTIYIGHTATVQQTSRHISPNGEDMLSGFWMTGQGTARNPRKPVFFRQKKVEENGGNSVFFLKLEGTVLFSIQAKQGSVKNLG